MSGGWVAAAVATVTAGAQMYSSRQQSKAQRQAADRQAQASTQARLQQEQDFRAENQNEVDVSNVMGQNTGSDISSTMLTGPGGIGLNDLQLGKGSTLLGG